MRATRMRLNNWKKWLAGAACTIMAAADPSAAWATQYEYDSLGRLVRVTYDNGDWISYAYDAAGNIIASESSGRASRSICGVLGNKGSGKARDLDRFTFQGQAGEVVTLRLEAEPRESGAGRSATLSLQDKVGRGNPGFFRSDSGVLPGEITVELARAQRYVVFVEQGDYRGGYCLTLEALPKTCQSLSQKGH